MSDDLVKRLRNVPPCNGCGEYPGGDIAQIMAIAANGIEALEEQVRAADALADALEAYENAAVDHMDFQARLDAALAAYRATKEGGE